MVQRQMGPGMIVNQQVQVDSKEKCREEQTDLEVLVEKGMGDGSKITFERMSEQTPGQIPGDVVMKLKSIPHNTFKRNRDTLSMKLAIPLRAALLGFETAFKHLDGHSVSVKRSGVTKPGQVLRIKGEGMPKHGTPSEFGDLLITFTVDFPKSVEGALADGLESLLPPFSKTDIRIFQ